MTPDDHPVRTIFIECVMTRTELDIDRARKFIAPISTDLIDAFWPIEEVVAQFQRGDMVATYRIPNSEKRK